MDMHLCAAKCCEDRSSNIEVVQRCVQNCSVGVTKAERYVHTQLQDFQNRLQRCVMVRFDTPLFHPPLTGDYLQQCNDDIKGIMPADPTDSEIDKYTGQFERCAVKCIDKHVDLIPNLLKTVKSVLSKGPNKIPDV